MCFARDVTNIGSSEVRSLYCPVNNHTRCPQRWAILKKRAANNHNSIGYIKEHQLDDSRKRDACDTVLNKYVTCEEENEVE